MRNADRTNPIQTSQDRSVSLQPRGGPRDGALETPVLLFMHASVVGHASDDLRLGRPTVSSY